jgi:hypothetical protein
MHTFLNMVTLIRHQNYINELIALMVSPLVKYMIMNI